jgi:hypothetical protein
MSAGNHDLRFPDERKAFMACVTEAGLKYEAVKAAYLAAGLPKPSSDAGLRQRLWSGLKLGKTLEQAVAEELALRASAVWSWEKLLQDYRLGYLASLEFTNV